MEELEIEFLMIEPKKAKRSLYNRAEWGSQRQSEGGRQSQGV